MTVASPLNLFRVPAPSAGTELDRKNSLPPSTRTASQILMGSEGLGSKPKKRLADPERNAKSRRAQARLPILEFVIFCVVLRAFDQWASRSRPLIPPLVST